MCLKLSDSESPHNHIGLILRCVGAGIMRNAAFILIFAGQNPSWSALSCRAAGDPVGAHYPAARSISRCSSLRN
jgi:hypothetical protein